MEKESYFRKFLKVKYSNTCLKFKLKRAASTVNPVDSVQAREVIFSSTVQI